MSSYLRWLDPTVRQSCPHDDSEATLRVNCAGLGTKPIPTSNHASLPKTFVEAGSRDVWIFTSLYLAE